MADRDKTAVQKIDAAPAWLAKAAEKDTSRDSLKEHLVLPKLNIVPMQPGEKMKKYKDQYGDGALVITPHGIAIAPHDTWVKIVPLFSFTEFRQWHDRDDSESAAVIARTHDATSEIARKARSEDRREEVYGDPNRKVKGKIQPFMYQFVEHICFVCMIYDGEARGQAAVLEFQRGSLWMGKEFSTAIFSRAVEGVECPTWAQVWEIQTTQTTRKGYTWWAIEYRNPEDGQLIITDEEAASFERGYENHKEANAAQRLVVDLNDSEVEGAVEAEVVDDGEM